MLPTEALAQLDKEVKARSFNNTPIVELSISIRLYNCLANAGIADIGGILALKTYGDIREIRHLGKKCAHELIGVMRGMGYDDWADEIVSTKKRSTPQNLIH
jgi:DNA-directed RNA polymerase alpha subunit